MEIERNRSACIGVPLDGKLECEDRANRSSCTARNGTAIKANGWCADLCASLIELFVNRLIKIRSPTVIGRLQIASYTFVAGGASVITSQRLTVSHSGSAPVRTDLSNQYEDLNVYLEFS